MDYKINNTVSNDRNDWRFTGQDEYLMGVQLIRRNFDLSDRDHDHCVFCFEKFDSASQSGYCTTNNYHWICESCFNDFREMFKWTLV